MATLYVSEFGDLAIGRAQAMTLPPLRMQTVAIGASSETTAFAFTENTRMVRVHTDAICSIAASAAPTATTSDLRLAADQTEYFGVKPGDKIAVIANT